MNLDRYQVQNLWEQINRTNKKQIAVGMDISENWTFFILILPYFFCLAFLENKIQKNRHFLLWRISELLGRAGFEPA